jgi:acetyltransferase-like isoleucine patch superfamily enzyme
MDDSELNYTVGEKTTLTPSFSVNSPNPKEQVTIGSNCLLECEVILWDSFGKVEIGDNTFIGKYSTLWSASLIKIGNHVQIGRNCSFFDNNVHSQNHLERRLEYLHNKSKHITILHDVDPNPLIIEDDVWIGAYVQITKGITIGEGAIIGAGSTATKSIPPFSMFAGNPARFIKKVD